MIMSTNTEVKTAGSSANKTKTMALIGVMAAVTCILGPLSLAIPDVYKRQAFYTACSSFIGQNYGAGNKERVRNSYFVSLAYSFGIGLVIGVTLEIFGTRCV